jgi:hypothetical protein
MRELSHLSLNRAGISAASSPEFTNFFGDIGYPLNFSAKIENPPSFSASGGLSSDLFSFIARSSMFLSVLRHRLPVDADSWGDYTPPNRRNRV